MHLILKPVSHRAYGLYDQACTVSTYGHPQNLPQIRSRTVSTYGLVRSAHTVSTVTHGRCRSGRSKLAVETVQPTVETVRPTVETVRPTVETVQAIEQAESDTVSSHGLYGFYGQPLRSLRSAPTVSTVSLTVGKFCSRAKISYGLYGVYGHANSQPTVSVVS